MAQRLIVRPAGIWIVAELTSPLVERVHRRVGAVHHLVIPPPSRPQHGCPPSIHEGIVDRVLAQHHPKVMDGVSRVWQEGEDGGVGVELRARVLGVRVRVAEGHAQ